MPEHCAAYSCSNRRTIANRARGITFHKFPKGNDLRKKWEAALRRESFTASNASVLCSEHFTPGDFDRTGQNVRLRDGVIPSVFSFPDHLQKKSSILLVTDQKQRKMPDFCAAYGCSNERSVATRARGITFHNFPKNAERRKRWEVALRRDGFVASDRTMLCSEHFKPEELDRTGQTIRLRDGVVPSVFNFPAHLPKISGTPIQNGGRVVKRLSLPVVTRTTRTSMKAAESLSVDRSVPVKETEPLPNVDHSYALPTSPAEVKARLNQALTRADGLERELKNTKHREQRAKNMVHGLLEQLKRKHLIIKDLKKRLSLYSGGRNSDLTVRCRISPRNAATQDATASLSTAEMPSALAAEEPDEPGPEACQGEAEQEELRMLLEVVGAALRSGLDGSVGREATSENSSCGDDGRISNQTQRVLTAGDSEVRHSPIILWKGRAYEHSSVEDKIQIITEDGLELIHTISDEGLFPEAQDQDQGDPDYQAGAPGGQGYATKRRRLSKPRGPRARRDRPRKENRPQLSREQLTQPKVHQAAEKPFVCPQCGRGFSFKHSLDSHTLLHTGERPHACDVCGKGFTLKRLLSTHRRRHAGLRPFRCAECGKSFHCAHGLKRHRVVHTRERAYGCQVCGKSFSLPGNLHRHRRIHTGEKPFSCQICGRSFNQADTLKAHQRAHSGERQFTCVACRAKLLGLGALTTHLQSHEAEMPRTCSVCNISLASLDHLHTHQQQHATEKPHICSQCGKAFRTTGCLKTHLKTHTGERPFACVTCGKTFTQQGSLKTHQAIHTGEKPFGCLACGKCFNNPANLKRHQRIHTGEKPYSCETCGRNFNQRNSLKAHQQIHTGEKLMCDKCGKTYSYLRNLKDHKCSVG